MLARHPSCGGVGGGLSSTALQLGPEGRLTHLSPLALLHSEVLVCTPRGRWERSSKPFLSFHTKRLSQRNFITTL